MDARNRTATGAWLLTVPAVVVGAATHVLWDELTHGGRWGACNLSWLADQHGALPGYTWLQYLSGLIGAAAVSIVWAALLWHALQPRRTFAR